MDSKFVRAKEAKEILKVSTVTLRKYGDTGKIECVRLPSGKRLYNIQKYLIDRNINSTTSNGKKVCYCRVSSQSQSDDLERQVNFMKERYPDHEIISDIGSGINFDRKGLNYLIDLAIIGELKELVISYKDRLCRIGYNLIERLLTKYSSTNIIIVNDNTETVNEEMANDVLQILTVYTAKIHGMRKYNKKLQIS